MSHKYHDDTHRLGSLSGAGTHAVQVRNAQSVTDGATTQPVGQAVNLVATGGTRCQACGGNRIAQVLARCSDMCGVEVAGRRHHGYVPRDLGIGGGDDVQFAYCLECGRIRGQFPLPRTPLEDDPTPDETG